MSDGAHLGVGAERALGSILGDEPSPETTGEECMTPVQMREYLESQEGPSDYSGTSAYIGKLVLHWLLADPSRAQLPTETEYDWQADPDSGSQGMKPEFIKQLGVYDLMKAEGIEFPEGFTGFMWGWAVNAARYCVELPPTPNPAIVTIGDES